METSTKSKKMFGNILFLLSLFLIPDESEAAERTKYNATDFYYRCYDSKIYVKPNPFPGGVSLDQTFDPSILRGRLEYKELRDYDGKLVPCDSEKGQEYLSWSRRQLQ